MCVQLNDGLKDVHALISRTWEHYLTGKKKKKKKDFIDVIKLKIMRWGDNLDRPKVIPITL